MQDKAHKVITIMKALDAAFPEHTAEGLNRHLAEQMVDLVGRARTKGYDLSRATLTTRGARHSPLGKWLKQLREQAGLTQRDATARTRTRWTKAWHEAKIARIEVGAVGVTDDTIMALVRIYGIKDQALINRLREMAADDRQRREGIRKAS